MTLDIATHKTVLFQILKDIYSDTTLSPFLGFKGGTAALMFYGLNRFSVDLDFDLLDETKEDYVFERIIPIIKRHGTLKESHKKRFSLFCLLSYEDKAHNIKVEINRRQFGSRYELKTYLGVSMLVMVPEDMFAHKLMAMDERIGRGKTLPIFVNIYKNQPAYFGITPNRQTPQLYIHLISNIRKILNLRKPEK
jgi:predicted nucleotidyltransferase component of viral defense system